MEGKMPVVANLRLVEPSNIYRKVPTRKPNAEMRTREYLTPAEVEKLVSGDEAEAYEGVWIIEKDQ
jgi:hypothetical protein